MQLISIALGFMLVLALGYAVKVVLTKTDDERPN